MSKINDRYLASHLATTVEKVTADAGRAWLKVYQDAIDAKCAKEFGLALKGLGLEDEARHFLGEARLKKLR